MRIDTWNRTGPIMRSVLASLIALLLVTGPAFAAEPAGRVLITTGVVTATDRDGFERPLSRNDVVYAGETLRTGPRGRLQVRFHDDALIDLRPETVFEIERYREATADEGGSAIMNLLRGALRTITGAIGHGEDDVYAVSTPVATIGIRGTDYSLEFCDAACAGNGRAPGLYGRVDDGSIVAETGAGASPFATGDYFFVPQGGAPQRIIAPPEGILVGDEDEESEGESVTEDEVDDVTITEDDEGGGGPGDDPLAGSDGSILGTVEDPGYIAGEEQGNLELGLLVGAVFAGAAGDEGLAFGFDRGGNGFRFDGEGKLIEASFDERLHLNVGNADRLQFNTIDGDDFDVTWGTWDGTWNNGGFLADGKEIVGRMVYVYTNDLTQPSAIGPNLGEARFQLVDGPDAVSVSGPWSVDTFALEVDFADVTANLSVLELNETIDGVRSRFYVTFSDQELDISDGVIAGSGLSGNYNQNGDPIHPVSGNMDGFFLGKGADGALVMFSVDSADELAKFESIHGISILKRFSGQQAR